MDNWLARGMLAYEELPGSGSGLYRFRRIRLADLDAFLDGFRHEVPVRGLSKSRPKIILHPRNT